MEEFDRTTLRGIREQMEYRERKRGSRIITAIILLIFLGAGVFYVKTSKPAIWDKCISFVKSITAVSLETVNDSVFDSIGESGEILKDAQNINFDYVSQPLEYALLSNTYTPPVCLPLASFKVTSDFGARTDPVTSEKNATHHGIDLVSSADSEIYAYKDGKVIFAGSDKIYGNCVRIDHGNGLCTFYAHLSKLSVSEGDSVSAGQSIGIIGSTGKSTGVHLHFEVIKDGERVDPADYLYEKI